MAAKAKRKQRNGPKRAALYARVSTKEQEREGLSLDAQERECSAFAAAQGWDVTMIEGEAQSGRNRNRSGFLNILEALDDLDVVLASSKDRMTRRKRHWSILVEEAVESGVEIWTVDRGYHDPDDLEAELMGDVESYVSEQEVKKFVARSMRGRRESAEQGFFVRTGVTPYGYTAERKERPESAGKTRTLLTPHPQQAAVVRRIYEMAASGHGGQAIANALTDDDIPPPQAHNPKRRGKREREDGRLEWAQGTITKLIRHTRNKGEATFDGVDMKAVPALVDVALWEQANRAMTRRKLHHGPKGSHQALLRSLLRCRRCGAGYSFEANLRKNTRTGKLTGGYWKRYHCSRRRRFGASEGHADITWSWQADELEERVKAAVLEMLDDPERIAADVRVSVEAHEQEMKRVPAKLRDLEEQIAEVDERRSRSLDAYERKLIDEAEFLQRRAVLDKERAGPVAERERLEAQGASAEQQQPTWFLEMLAETFASARVARLRGAVGGDEHGVVYYDHGGPAEQSDWAELLPRLITQIWVEDDGSLTIEGEGFVRSAQLR